MIHSLFASDTAQRSIYSEEFNKRLSVSLLKEKEKLNVSQNLTILSLKCQKSHCGCQTNYSLINCISIKRRKFIQSMHLCMTLELRFLIRRLRVLQFFFVWAISVCVCVFLSYSLSFNQNISYEKILFSIKKKYYNSLYCNKFCLLDFPLCIE